MVAPLQNSLSLKIKFPKDAKVVETTTARGTNVTLYGHNRNGKPDWSTIYVKFIDPETKQTFIGSKLPDEYKSKNGQRGISITTRPGKGLFLTIPASAFKKACRHAEEMRIKQLEKRGEYAIT